MEHRPFSDASYNQFLNEEKLMGSQCKGCGTTYVPPRPLCVKCYKSDMEWVEIKGKGKLAAFTCITIAPPFMMAQGYGRKHPYCSGVVDLDEGGRVDARIEGVDALHPENIKVGMPMKAKFLHGEGAQAPETYLAFEPA
jgi:scaffold protein (connect acetoacetyl-CoA thiolase and HMG-CoA synthase)